MIVGIIQISLVIPYSSSLKEKRMVLKSLFQRVKNNFNVSIAEVEHNDFWQKSMIGVSMVGNEKPYVESVLSKVVDFVRKSNGVELADYAIEIL